MQRFATVVAGVWAGLLLGIGAIAAPTAFTVLARADAGRFVNRVFMTEAYVSLAVALLLFLVERRRTRDAAEAGIGSHVSAELVLLLGTLLCTVGGYFAIQPMLEAARAGQGRWSFGTLHAVSSALFVLKGVLVIVLAWRFAACGLSAGSVRPSATSTTS